MSARLTQSPRRGVRLGAAAFSIFGRRGGVLKRLRGKAPCCPSVRRLERLPIGLSGVGQRSVSICKGCRPSRRTRGSATPRSARSCASSGSTVPSPRPISRGVWGSPPSYLNLIEKGRRTVQLPLLWKAPGSSFGVEPEPFLDSLGEQPVEQSLALLLDEPLLRTLNLDRDDLATISAEPMAVTTVTTLFNLYKNTRSQLEKLQQLLSRREAGEKARALLVRHGQGTGVDAASPTTRRSTRSWIFSRLTETTSRKSKKRGAVARRDFSGSGGAFSATLLVRALDRARSVSG